MRVLLSFVLLFVLSCGTTAQPYHSFLNYFYVSTCVDVCFQVTALFTCDARRAQCTPA